MNRRPLAVVVLGIKVYDKLRKRRIKRVMSEARNEGHAAHIELSRGAEAIAMWVLLPVEFRLR